jgi:diaminohydroxyphosphoribosylaminopyrimidine deaminase / 5-amino-6-(5-phosphoribosylamino)uracil reductase
MKQSEKWMALALAQAAVAMRQGCYPYPGVGVVLICPTQDQPIVARAHNNGPGEEHAELRAVAQWEKLGGKRPPAELLQLYTNLEPCCNPDGLVGSCSEIIIRSGIPEVHIAITDPYYQVNGQGLAALEAAGVKCFLGELATEARHLMRPYLDRFCPHCGWPVTEL